jgi:uncharacterized protein (DUF3084 family)
MNAFLRELSKVPVDSVDERSSRMKEIWTEKISSINDEIGAIKTELDLARSQKKKLDMELASARDLYSRQKAEKDKLDWRLGKLMSERSSLEVECDKEESQIIELRAKIEDCKLKRESASKIFQHEIETTKKNQLKKQFETKQELEKELVKLSKEILELQELVEEGKKFKMDKIMEIKRSIL